MLYQEGSDVGALLFPMLLLVGVCFIGLVTWLIIILTRTKKGREDQPVKQQPVNIPGKLPSYILAIGRSGAEWEIYVKGMRVNNDTIYDGATRKEVLDALRVLARYARHRLQDGAEPMRAIPELAGQTAQPQPELFSGVEPSSVEIDLTGTSRTQTRPAVTTDYATASSSVSDMNLAREIGEIVEELLDNTPALQGHAVNLINAQTDGISFVVDGAVYKAVEDIPNAEIQELIRRATREWERR